MATQKCQHCNGRGELTRGRPGEPRGPYSCAYCEAELCQHCFVVNDHQQVICPTHDKKFKVESGGYVNSPQWNGLCRR